MAEKSAIVVNNLISAIICFKLECIRIAHVIYLIIFFYLCTLYNYSGLVAGYISWAIDRIQSDYVLCW